MAAVCTDTERLLLDRSMPSNSQNTLGNMAGFRQRRLLSWEADQLMAQQQRLSAHTSLFNPSVMNQTVVKI
jgi:hypothetical protein